MSEMMKGMIQKRAMDDITCTIVLGSHPSDVDLF
jgi:hypothetical protein